MEYQKDINKGVKNEHEAVRYCVYEIMNLFIEPASNSYKRSSRSFQDIVSEIISKDTKMNFSVFFSIMLPHILLHRISGYQLYNLNVE